ncbi:hypothetical protein L3Q82_006958 [Scortum barcoo]|uniref:Uncharacterized protein n=1 Tax=Scortum barcoo TaxID=214431 RepID=A0ACB8WWG1_9TELE|nr:hypothetical protein L3Q82_006958 [Scortum barcoo]
MPAETRQETKEISCRDLFSPTNPPFTNARRHETHYLDGIRQHPSQYWIAYDDNDDPQSNMPPAPELPGCRLLRPSHASETPEERPDFALHRELGGYQYWPVLVPRGIRLYTYEQIPVFLRENPYITDGYRAYLPSRLCIKSLFILSNETVNIWSHLLGFLLFFFVGVYNMASVLPAVGASREDYVIYSIGLFCFQLCMLCSVGYHLFCCHRSEKTSRRWMALDYAGVSIGILGCYVPGVFYTFYCNNYWRQVYLPVTVTGHDLAMILAVFFAQIHPHYLSKQWKQLRSLIFCSVAGYGLVPTVHWICITGGFSSELVQAFVPRVLGMYFIAALALIFYVSKVPERYFPDTVSPAPTPPNTLRTPQCTLGTDSVTVAECLQFIPVCTGGTKGGSADDPSVRLSVTADGLHLTCERLQSGYCESLTSGTYS